MAQSRSAACDLLSGEAGNKEERREERGGGGRPRLSKGGEEMEERCEEWSLSYINVSGCSTPKIRSFKIVIYSNMYYFKAEVRNIFI